MKAQKWISIIAGTLMLAANITPIFAIEASDLNTDTVKQIYQDEISGSTDIIHEFIDGIQIQAKEALISWAEKAGVVHGYGDGTFKPDAAVTREQVAVMLANYAQYKGAYIPGTKKLNEYPDGSQVSTWPQAGMKWAITYGIISGNGAGYRNPKKSVTRAEGAAMLLRMKKWLQ